MPGDTLYVRNLQIESNTSASGNGFSSTGYGNLSYDGTEILGTGGVGNWTKDGTSIYYDGGNVGIQNTNPQHALSIGSPSNVYVDTSSKSLYIVTEPADGDIDLFLTRNNTTGKITQSTLTPGQIATNMENISQLQSRGLQEVTSVGATTTNNIGFQNTNPQYALTLGEWGNNGSQVMEANGIVKVNGAITTNGSLVVYPGSLVVGTGLNVSLSVDATNGNVYVPSILYLPSTTSNIVTRVSSNGELIDRGPLTSFLASSFTTQSSFFPTLGQSGYGYSIINFFESFPYKLNTTVKRYTVSFEIIRTGITTNADTIGLQLIKGVPAGFPASVGNYRNLSVSSTPFAIISDEPLSSTSSKFSIDISYTGVHFNIIGVNCVSTNTSGLDNKPYTTCCKVNNADVNEVLGVRILLANSSAINVNTTFTINKFDTIAHTTF